MYGSNFVCIYNNVWFNVWLQIFFKINKDKL